VADNGFHQNDIIETIAYKKETDPESGQVKRTRGPIGEYQVKIYLQQASPMLIGDLQKAVSLCETADEDFKTGRMNERMAAEALMVKLCKLGG